MKSENMKIILLQAVLALNVIILVGCGQTDAVVEPNQITESLELEEKDDMETVDINVLFLQENLDLSELRAKGAAQILSEAGCGEIIAYEDKVDGEHAYTVTLINSNGNKYYTAFDNSGFIGPVKDENGTYLYSPID